MTIREFTDNTIIKAGYKASWVCMPLGINDPEEEGYLMVFPNPSEGMVNLKYVFSGQKDLSVCISNMMGQEVYKELLIRTTNYSRSIDLTTFAKGIYNVVITSNNSQVTRKLIIE